MYAAPMRLLLPWIVCGVLCVGAGAQAQGSADQKAAAEALFDKGLAAMKQGEYAQACAFLEQSQSVERGIGTMLYLAECYEKLGRTASAWAMFREAASAAKAARIWRWKSASRVSAMACFSAAYASNFAVRFCICRANSVRLCAATWDWRAPSTNCLVA